MYVLVLTSCVGRREINASPLRVCPRECGASNEGIRLLVGALHETKVKTNTIEMESQDSNGVGAMKYRPLLARLDESVLEL